MRQPLLTAALSVVVTSLIFSGCRKKGEDTDDEAAPEVQPDARDEFGLTTVEKRWWVEKTARLLHHGRGLTDDAEIARLARLPYADVAKELMTDELFYETALDFNFYYFGLKSDAVTYPKKDDLLSSFANFMRIPNAVDGARALREDGDYMQMLTATPRLYAAPLGPVIEFDGDEIKVAPDAAARRKELYAETETGIDDLVRMVQANPQEFPDGSFCRAFFDNVKLNQVDTGFPDYLQELLFNLPAGEMIGSTCYKKPVDPAVMVPLLETFRLELRGLLAKADALEPEVYLPQKLADVRTVDLEALGLEGRRSEFGLTWFWQTLPNSSTNYDRKRANYVLKRFFCDDLTPVSVLLPKDHAEGRHAADPGCQACHYKLDPMAGFFRTVGSGGTDYGKLEGQKKIFFDDGASLPLDEYVEAWKAPAGSGRTWDVGYVRSTTHPELNTYAAHSEKPVFEDLFTLMQGAPEVKQCLVRRMFEYFVGVDQVVDSGYLEHLTQAFIDTTAAENSSAAFKNAVTSLVTSATFRTKDPASEHCYDRAPGDATPEAERPPCRVAFILQKNCESCHKGEGAAGGLDLSRWAVQADGKPGFAHRSPEGQPVETQETLKRIYDRMVSTDPALRMPLNKEIPIADRDTLFLWINKTLEAEK